MPNSATSANAFALCDAVNRLEQGAGAMVTSSGLSACTQALLAFVGAGDHVLMPDSVYGPQRMFCETILRRFGVETTFYDPRIGADMDILIKANTRVVYTEAPGSLTFEMQDIPAIVKAAHAHGAIVIMDNTWAGPLYFKPLTVGVDICVEAATKFIAGHSDLVMGIIIARTDELYRLLLRADGRNRLPRRLLHGPSRSANHEGPHADAVCSGPHACTLAARPPRSHAGALSAA